MRELNKPEQRELDKYNRFLRDKLRKGKNKIHYEQLGGIFSDKENMNELFDVLKHKKSGVGIRLNEKSNSLFVMMHGSKEGKIPINNVNLTNEDLGYILQLENLIPESVKTIYTMSCYGGLQQPFTLPNGVEIKSFHESQQPIKVSSTKLDDSKIVNLMESYKGKNKVKEIVGNSILFNIFSTDDKKVTPELRSFFKKTRTITDIIDTDKMQKAIDNYFNLGLTDLSEEEVKKVYGAYNKKRYELLGQEVPENLDKLRKDFIYKKTKEYLEKIGPGTNEELIKKAKSFRAKLEKRLDSPNTANQLEIAREHARTIINNIENQTIEESKPETVIETVIDEDITSKLPEPKLKIDDIPVNESINNDIPRKQITLPKLTLPKLTLPKVEFPKLKIPKIELPKIDVSKIKDILPKKQDIIYKTQNAIEKTENIANRIQNNLPKKQETSKRTVVQSKQETIVKSTVQPKKQIPKKQNTLVKKEIPKTPVSNIPIQETQKVISQKELPKKKLTNSTPLQNITPPRKPNNQNIVITKSIEEQLDIISSNNINRKTNTSVANKADNIISYDMMKTNNIKPIKQVEAVQDMSKTMVNSKQVANIAKYMSSSGNRYGKTIGNVINALV